MVLAPPSWRQHPLLVFLFIFFGFICGWASAQAQGNVSVDDQDSHLSYSSGAWIQTQGNAGALNGTLSSTIGGNVSVAFTQSSDVLVQCVFTPEPLSFVVILDNVKLATVVANSSGNSPTPSGSVGTCAQIPGIPNPSQTHVLLIQVLSSNTPETETSNWTLDSFIFVPSNSPPSTSPIPSSLPSNPPPSTSPTPSSPTTLPSANSTSSAPNGQQQIGTSVSRGAVIFSAVVATIVALGLGFCLYFFIRRRRNPRNRKGAMAKRNMSMNTQFNNFSFEQDSNVEREAGASISIPPKVPVQMMTQAIPPASPNVQSHYIPQSTILAQGISKPIQQPTTNPLAVESLVNDLRASTPLPTPRAAPKPPPQPITVPHPYNQNNAYYQPTTPARQRPPPGFGVAISSPTDMEGGEYEGEDSGSFRQVELDAFPAPPVTAGGSGSAVGDRPVSSIPPALRSGNSGVLSADRGFGHSPRPSTSTGHWV